MIRKMNKKESLVLSKLSGRDRRSIGHSNDVVSEVLKNQRLFGDVFEGMLSTNPIIRMRSADATEKITALHPEYLFPFKHKLIYHIAKIQQQEVQWHVAQMLPRLNLTEKECNDIIEILVGYTKTSHSSIVRTFAMQALADIAERRVDFRSRALRLIERLTENGTPAMRNRGRKLLMKLKEV